MTTPTDRNEPSHYRKVEWRNAIKAAWLETERAVALGDELKPKPPVSVAELRQALITLKRAHQAATLAATKEAKR